MTRFYLQTFSFIAFASIALFTLGCQTNELRAYERVQVGMDKDQVLDLMGSPQQSRRWQGQDRWDYTFYHDDVKHEKQINFQNGKAVYVGDPVKPAITAEEQDSIYEKANLELDKKWAEERARQRESYPAFESDVRGESPDQKVPTFKPVGNQ